MLLWKIHQSLHMTRDELCGLDVNPGAAWAWHGAAGHILTLLASIRRTMAARRLRL